MNVNLRGILLGVVLTFPLAAQVGVEISFEQLRHQEEPFEFYHGRYGSQGSGPGPLLGIIFSKEAQAVFGGTRPEGEPVKVHPWYQGEKILKVSGDRYFRIDLAEPGRELVFIYNAILLQPTLEAIEVRFYSEPEGKGKLLLTQYLGDTNSFIDPDRNTGCEKLPFCHWLGLYAKSLQEFRSVEFLIPPGGRAYFDNFFPQRDSGGAGLPGFALVPVTERSHQEK
ncbi:MAG: hypothetical protein NZV14_04800 [Bryobacteraceae bacterium]|nr:hypothetical protein [Bryobacteraceae bacterium]MDW8377453.1 hypothetical protein [Bryobacterales bacterium]